MIKRKAERILFLALALLTLGGYVYLKSTERSRFAENAYKIFINISETGLEVNEKQLEKIIKYADKLEKKGDLESIRFCFSLRRAVMITLFTEMQKVEKIYRGYSLSTENSVSTNFNKEVFLELCDMNRFDENKLIERIPVENNTIISNLYAANISVQDILSCTNFLYKDSVRLNYRTILENDIYQQLYDLRQESSVFLLNPTMQTSDEQFAQTICIIQDFRDLYINAEVYKRYSFLPDYKQIDNKIEEILLEKGIVKRVDTFGPEKSAKVYGVLDWYNDVSKFQGRVLLCLEPCMNDLSCLPEEYKTIFEKQRKWREEQNND